MQTVLKFTVLVMLMILLGCAVAVLARKLPVWIRAAARRAKD